MDPIVLAVSDEPDGARRAGLRAVGEGRPVVLVGRPGEEARAAGALAAELRAAGGRAAVLVGDHDDTTDAAVAELVGELFGPR